jgi:hypothetical protein
MYMLGTRPEIDPKFDEDDVIILWVKAKSDPEFS